MQVAFRASSKPDVFDVAVLVRRVKKKELKNGRIWELINLDHTLPYLVDCDGLEMKPKLVLKMYCKIPMPKWEKYRRERIIKHLRSKKPVIF